MTKKDTNGPDPCVIEHHYHSGQKNLYTFTVFKYDFRHRLLLEETDYDDRLRRDYDKRKAWTYSK